MDCMEEANNEMLGGLFVNNLVNNMFVKFGLCLVQSSTGPQKN